MHAGKYWHILQKQSKKYNKVERILSRFITINDIAIVASDVLASLAMIRSSVKRQTEGKSSGISSDVGCLCDTSVSPSARVLIDFVIIPFT